MLQLFSLIFGCAGVIAQTIYLVVQRPTIAAQYGWMLMLAWILGIFYLYGSLHHRKLAWGIFVLPLVLGLVLIAKLFSPTVTQPQAPGWFSFQNPRFLSVAHVTLVLLAAVGICVAFLSSVMYLVQSYRLKAKSLPDKKRWKLPSLERLESMSRHAIGLAFPMLTVGIFLGMLLMFRSKEEIHDWTDPRVLSTVALWIVLAIVMYLRYARHLGGRRVAFFTIAAFFMLLITFVLSHSVSGGVG